MWLFVGACAAICEGLYCCLWERVWLFVGASVAVCKGVC